ncbi:Lrp/AsnC family transcriptional regulator [Abyssibius alkaniclasticus]|uniref:Lrp/AsnC family transcriptional regulator n=1 Tax=Abyssibius alkaniclasticus TaxID=2881234 RepID=UPI002363F512|nr:Lrp/AsnC family transcriptional regulator [Abyssibius alkaniclasticus]UPH70878.1 Lrp/AsnC family transcriptional regulator [Abyssibius alkaniclasticus]|tara:strand:- start:2113 stop:2571 length:459 start_codon:yes stop_codon:yes gene_type:complete
MQVDDTDRRLLRLLQASPTISTADLAVQAGMTVAPCWRRLEKLKTAGVLKGKRVVVDMRALGYGVQVFLRINLDKTAPNAFAEFLAAARDIAEVDTIQTLLGRVDIRMDVLARDLAHYQDIYKGKILALPHIADIEALMLVSEVKNTEALPL